VPDLVEWRGVYSKSVKRVGYNHPAAELYVEWLRTGRISIYGPKFPFEKFDQLSKTVSVGSMMREEIQPKFNHRYAS